MEQPAGPGFPPVGGNVASEPRVGGGSGSRPSTRCSATMRDWWNQRRASSSGQTRVEQIDAARVSRGNFADQVTGRRSVWRAGGGGPPDVTAAMVAAEGAISISFAGGCLGLQPVKYVDYAASKAARSPDVVGSPRRSARRKDFRVNVCEQGSSKHRESPPTPGRRKPGRVAHGWGPQLADGDGVAMLSRSHAAILWLLSDEPPTPTGTFIRTSPAGR